MEKNFKLKIQSKKLFVWNISLYEFLIAHGCVFFITFLNSIFVSRYIHVHLSIEHMLNSHYFDCFERTPSMSFKTHFKNLNNFFNKQIVQLLHKNSLLLGYKSQLLQSSLCLY